jgi:5-methylcytosine-specific restriction endonuclease McrA
MHHCMNRWQPEATKSELEIPSELRQTVMRRDGWRCQNCGRLGALQVHHIVFRSHQGTDTEENMITLCAECHQQVHCRQTKNSRSR